MRGRGCAWRAGGRSRGRSRVGRRRGPGVPVAGAVGEPADVVSEAFVAGPAEADGAVFAGLFGHGGLAGVGGEGVAVRVAGAVVADLGEQAGGAHDALGVAEEAEEDRPVGVA